MAADGRERRLAMLAESRPWKTCGIWRLTGYRLNREFTLSAIYGHSLVQNPTQKIVRSTLRCRYRPAKLSWAAGHGIPMLPCGHWARLTPGQIPTY